MTAIEAPDWAVITTLGVAGAGGLYALWARLMRRIDRLHQEISAGQSAVVHLVATWFDGQDDHLEWQDDQILDALNRIAEVERDQGLRPPPVQPPPRPRNLARRIQAAEAGFRDVTARLGRPGGLQREVHGPGGGPTVV